MSPKESIRAAGRLLGWATAGLVSVMLLTGYGITQFRIVDAWTGGWLGKAAAQRWHEWLGVPILIAMLVHVGIAVWWRARGGRSEGGRR
jgi:hypothetical protein